MSQQTLSISKKPGALSAQAGRVLPVTLAPVASGAGMAFAAY